MPPVYNTACLPHTDPLYLHSCSPQQYLQSVSPPFHLEPVRTHHVTCQNTKTPKTHIHLHLPWHSPLVLVPGILAKCNFVIAPLDRFRGQSKPTYHSSPLLSC